MAIYEDYKCNDCNTVFVFAKVWNDSMRAYEDFPESAPCKNCGSTNTKRCITIGGIHIPAHMKAGS